jgi:hypothetical protein
MAAEPAAQDMRVRYPESQRDVADADRGTDDGGRENRRPDHVDAPAVKPAGERRKTEDGMGMSVHAVRYPFRCTSEDGPDHRPHQKEERVEDGGVRYELQRLGPGTHAGSLQLARIRRRLDPFD